MATGVHLLVFPYPAQGHMLALLDLTHQLSLRGLTITIIVTPKNLPILSPILSKNPSIQTLILPFPHHNSSIPPGVENVKDLGNQANIPIITALAHLKDPIIRWCNSHPNPPVAILSDFFLGWTLHPGIPRIAFYSSGPFLAAVFDSLWSNPQPILNQNDVVTFEYLPRAPQFQFHQIPSLYRRYMELQPGNPTHQILTDSMAANASSWACIFNSFYELESEFVDYLNQKTDYPRAYCVGPLNMTTIDDDSIQGLSSWLDQWAHGSVLYVCFGSQKLFQKAQIDALASALERSGVPFVWVVKPVTAQQLGSIPDGFEERVSNSNRGFCIRGWAPQTWILRHRSVGVFLSHCGWNSVLEAIMAGVMILGWPMEADQFVNAKLLVDYKGAAVVAVEGDIVPDSDDLARKIGDSVRGNGAERVRAKELSNQAREAINVGGSSSRDLDEIVHELNKLKV